MLTTITIAAAASFALTPLAKILAIKFDAVSRPDMDRKKHIHPTAQWGGVAVYLALLLSIVADCFTGKSGFDQLSLPMAIAISGGLLCLLGAYDDMVEIRARWKFLGQIAAIMPMILAGYYFERLSLFGISIELGPMGALCTVAWMLLAINALNLIDGMDGLASIIGLTTALAVAAIAGIQSQPAVMMPALALAAALTGFLYYNLPPARIYLGDCGSMLIGFTLSLLAMQVSLDADGNANLTVISVLLFVPLLDTGLAILRRTLKGKSFASADREHIHHKLLDRGLKPSGVLALLGGLCLLSGIDAWLIAATQNEIWTWITMGALFSVMVNRQLIGHQEWLIAKRLIQQYTARLVLRLTAPQSLSKPRKVPAQAAWPRIAILKFGREIANNEVPDETMQTANSTQIDTFSEPSENKAA